MNKQEMKTLLFDMLSGKLQGVDFKLKKSENRFIRNIADGWQDIGLPLWDYYPEFEFSLNICIRLEHVEEIFNKLSGAGPKYHAMTTTTITRLEYFTGDPGKYRVNSAADVAAAGGMLTEVIHKRILPFLDAHQSIQELDHAVNGQKPGIDVTQNPSGAMHAIILARLSGNKQYEHIVAKHRAAMQLVPTVAHPFNSLNDYLISI